jgi:hypothetical protein
MMNTEAVQIAALYLAQLEEEVKRLPSDQASEMVADIRDHIAAATAGEGGPARTRDVLDRLGSPRTLVDDALADASGAPTASAPPAPGQTTYGSLLSTITRRIVPSTTWSSRETTALACLIGAEVGFVLFPFAAAAWIWGLNRLTTSRVWTSREKTLAYLTLGLGFPLGVLALIAGAIALPLSVFNFGLHQVCDNGTGTGQNGLPNSMFGDLNSQVQPSICHYQWSPSHTLLTTLAVAAAALLIAQAFAVWKLIQARHRSPAAA